MKSFGLLSLGATLVTLFSCIRALPQGYDYHLGSVNASHSVPTIADTLSLASDLLGMSWPPSAPQLCADEVCLT